MSRFRVWGLLVVAGLVLASRPSVAQSLPSTRVVVAEAPPPAPPGRTSFRGRTAGSDPVDVALAVPRVLLYPLYLVSEYVLRRPLVAFTRLTESDNLHIWTFGILHPHRHISWSPAFNLALGFVPLFGGNATVDDVLFHGNQVRARGLFGYQAYDLALQDRVTVGWARFGLRESLYERPDLVFFGLGPRSVSHGLPRYHLRRQDVTVFAQLRPSHHFWLDLSASYRRDLTSPGLDDSITVHLDPNDPSQLPGFGELSLFIGQAELVVDSRARPGDATGFRLDATALGAADTAREDVRFGVATLEAAGAIEIVHPGRVIAGSIYLADSQAFGASPVPFTYQPTLGGTRLAGFLAGRFVGASAVMAEVHYVYPIQAHLDAIWQVAVGNVFGEHFAGFDAALLTGSAGVGLRSVFPDRDALEAIVALGSTRFGDTFGVDSVNLALSLNRGL